MKNATLSLLLLLLLPVAWLTAANTYTVCADCPISSIQVAVERASAGDLIEVQPGLYYEAGITIDKPLHLRGLGEVIIDGQLKDEIIIIAADSVTVEGFEFHNAGRSHIKDLAAIRVKRHDYFTIRNNRIIDAFFGIFIENGEDGLIADNVLLAAAESEMDAGNAIHCWYAERLNIIDNYISGYRDGIYLEFVHYSFVENNYSENNIRYGLHFMFSNNDQYRCNTFAQNGAGVAVMFSKEINMYENEFLYNWGQASYGLLLKEIYDAEIIDNQFDHNTIGILVEGCTRLEYRENDFRANGWAIQMSGGCLDNNFTQNNFQTNTLDLVVNSQVNNNEFNGNYWSEYAGYDLDRDGLGDVPHRPVKLYAYVISRVPESIILLRSLFIDLLNFSEKVSPAFTPDKVIDTEPLMQAVL